MKYVLAIDVAKNKSMVALINSSGEVLIQPYEIIHRLNVFMNLKEKINNFNIEDTDVTVFMESTSTYHLSIKRFFSEKTNYNIQIINPLYSSMHKRNLRKTKTDKQDCYNLAELFFTGKVKNYGEQEQYYMNMNTLSREYNFLLDEGVRFKNRFKKLVNLTFPEYEDIFKGQDIYKNTSLTFIEKYPHADIIANTRIDALANTMVKANNRHKEFYLKKATLIKIKAQNSFPAVLKGDETVDELVRTIQMLKYFNERIDYIKALLILEARDCYFFKNLINIEGLGELTAALIIAELKDINRFNNVKELTAYCGLDPSIKQSGSSINGHGHISKTGNNYIRKILFNAVCNIIVVCSKTNLENPILLYYRKKRNEGKHHYVAVIACTTKLLRRILAECKKVQNNM